MSTCPSCEAQNESGIGRCFACGEPLSGAESHPQQGSNFAGRYRIEGVLGRGGMGMVYRARDLTLDEVVALKIVRPDLLKDAEVRARFRSEIKLARRIRHRNVCSVFGDGEESGLLFLCMELVDGRDLLGLARQGSGFSWPDAFDITMQIAEGLQAIHDVGIIHRDLKTSNIMRDASGLVRLLDFGLARQLGESGSQGATGSGRVVGTPEYMSPEQGRGDTLTFGADIYALGVVVFELFTGQVPFKGDTPLRTMLMHLNDAPPLDGTAAARLPSALKPVLARALAKLPADRFTSVREMAEALRRARDLALGEGDTPLRLETATEAARQPARSLPHLLIAGVAVGLGFVAWQVIPTREPPATLPEPRAAADPPPRAPLAKPPAKAPTGFSGVDLTDLQAQASEEAGWAEYEKRLESDYAMVTSFDASEASAALKATAWARFLAAYKVDNPLSSVDETRRRGAQERLTALSHAARTDIASGPATPTERIEIDGADCMLVQEFATLSLQVTGQAAQVLPARLYFRSNLSDDWFFTEMKKGADGRYQGWLPKVTQGGGIRSITYYGKVILPDLRALSTSPREARMISAASECPAGRRIASTGKLGGIELISVNSAADETNPRWK